ncbi:hypothetical protein [Suttonella ornithocola]|uniref:hypothetical protein n=1 Tax=Suttonella ornithocola TaxID=279832 RepID=UPI000932C27F|nr:hypothetical protein [Suttonella ornithocola]
MEDEKQAIVDFVSNYSIELTPKTLLKLGNLHQYLPSTIKVYLTHLPGSDFADTITAVEKVITQGFEAVAHVAVRNIRRREALESGLKKLWRSGGRNSFVIGWGRWKCAISFPRYFSCFERRFIRRV